MGVIPCSRKNCNNVICETYLIGFGYICYSCLTELKHIVEDKDLTKEEMKEVISEFLDFYIIDNKDNKDNKKCSLDNFIINTNQC